MAPGHLRESDTPEEFFEKANITATAGSSGEYSPQRWGQMKESGVVGRDILPPGPWAPSHYKRRHGAPRASWRGFGGATESRYKKGPSCQSARRAKNVLAGGPLRKVAMDQAVAGDITSRPLPPAVAVLGHAADTVGADQALVDEIIQQKDSPFSGGLKVADTPPPGPWAPGRRKRRLGAPRASWRPWSTGPTGSGESRRAILPFYQH